MKTTYDERKFTELLVYVASRLQGDQSGGATKLNKILFFADFAHVRRTGSPITGAECQKLEHGPAARPLRPVRDRLIERGDAELKDEEFLGYRQHRLVPHRDADLTVFSDDELATINTRYRAALGAALETCDPCEHPDANTKGIHRDARNLSAAFFDHQTEILAFTTNLAIPFDNNQAERDLRMAKIAQKISYGWRTSHGVERFAAIRSYIETGRKHGHQSLDPLTQLFTTGPWTIPHPG